MSQRTPTRQKILEASQRLFNERGYAGTTLAEIASTAGIAEGNLWYHFPTKLDLVIALETRLREEVREALARRPTGGSVSDDYVESIVFSMKHQWENRFLLRDHLEFSTDGKPFRRDPDMAAQFERLRELLGRMEKEGMFRRDLRVDLETLAQALWIVSRYWTDHLREHEGLDRITWKDQERGIHNHFSVLQPYLTASARRDLESAVVRISVEMALHG